MLGGAGSLLAVLCLAATLTNEEPSLNSQPFSNETSQLHFAPLSPAPIVHPGGPSPAPPLTPGVYQTRPFAMILIVPKRGLDDGCIVGTTSAGSKMPVIKPELRAAPVLPSK
jgi:hypothetical protein